MHVSVCRHECTYKVSQTPEYQDEQNKKIKSSNSYHESTISHSHIWNTAEDIFSQLYQLFPIKAKLFSFKYHHGVICVSYSLTAKICSVYKWKTWVLLWLGSNKSQVVSPKTNLLSFFSFFSSCMIVFLQILLFFLWHSSLRQSTMTQML